MLENGTHATIAEIAAAEKINESYVGRILRLTFLAPDIAVFSENHIRTYWWCSPDNIGMATNDTGTLERPTQGRRAGQAR
jgi:hypothetical protein